MTVKQLYEMTCAQLFETPNEDRDLKTAFPLALNQVITEVIDYENMFRQNDGSELLKAEDVPFYTDADDTGVLPICEKLCRAALPLGMKAILLEEDGGKQAEAVIAYNKFVAALSDLSPAVFTSFITEEDEE